MDYRNTAITADEARAMLAAEEATMAPWERENARLHGRGPAGTLSDQFCLMLAHMRLSGDAANAGDRALRDAHEDRVQELIRAAYADQAAR